MTEISLNLYNSYFFGMFCVEVKRAAALTRCNNGSNDGSIDGNYGGFRNGSSNNNSDDDGIPVSHLISSSLFSLPIAAAAATYQSTHCCSVVGLVGSDDAVRFFPLSLPLSHSFTDYLLLPLTRIIPLTHSLTHSHHPSHSHVL